MIDMEYPDAGTRYPTDDIGLRKRGRRPSGSMGAEMSDNPLATASPRDSKGQETSRNDH
jgi:hypothetical protein